MMILANLYNSGPSQLLALTDGSQSTILHQAVESGDLEVDHQLTPNIIVPKVYLTVLYFTMNLNINILFYL